MNRTVILLSVLLAGCEQPPPPPEPTLSMSTLLGGACPPATPVKLIPAPAFETPVQRWKRTKANWESARKAEDVLREQLFQRTLPIFREYMNAEDQLQSVHCSKLCVPDEAR